MAKILHFQMDIFAISEFAIIYEITSEVAIALAFHFFFRPSPFLVGNNMTYYYLKYTIQPKSKLKPRPFKFLQPFTRTVILSNSFNRLHL